MITILAPTYRDISTAIENVKEWNIGKNTIVLSLGVTFMTRFPGSVFDRTFLLLSIAPFGLPVVPDVQMMTAVSSSPLLDGDIDLSDTNAFDNR